MQTAVPRRRERMCCAAALAGLAVTLAASCDSRPHAPALQDEPVYQNARKGFRFLVPEGWKQYAKAEVPPGPTEKERLLVGYRFVTETSSAQLEVSLADLPDWIDLAKYLAEPSQSVQKWQLVGAPEKLILSGAAAIRYTLASRSEKDKLTKEVTAFRRGDRTYFFTGVFRPGDERARDAVRQAVASVMWKE